MKKPLSITTICLIATTLLGLEGCSSLGVGGSDYTASQVRGEQSVRLGTVESIRKVRIQNDQPGVMGAVGGGVAGAALGSTIGRGVGNAAATVLGALALGAAGDAAQNALSSQDGVELTIRQDNGLVIAVTQGADEVFQVGERVQILGGGGAVRVTRLDSRSGLYGPRQAAPQSAAPMGSGTNNISYFCPDSNAYYPQVKQCPSPWMKVAH
ncbi:MAG: hypothetical protein M0Z78_08290 [Betaproteobacteria bacterium]|jgi:Outer membrane lipoprotein|nr:hypothetical protein [Betaproteobacteria bacterium]